MFLTVGEGEQLNQGSAVIKIKLIENQTKGALQNDVMKRSSQQR
jgi:hypothetical protein